MVLSLTIGRRIVFTLIRWTNDAFRSEYAVISMILIIMGVMALITDAIGVHTVLGAFVAGILVGESPILTDHIEGERRGVITALVMPVFFGMAGLSADLTVLADPMLALLTIGLVLIASVGKFSGAFVGGKLAGMSFREATAVGSAMNARGSTEVIVASIGLSMNILSHNLFTMIVTMAVITTLVMPPMLRWALGRLPVDQDEKERLERETLDERGFVSKLERLLLVVDDSPIGRFTAYLSGLISGSSGMPTTLLQLTEAVPKAGEAEKPQEHLDEIRRGAKASAAAVKRDEDMPVDKVHLTARTETSATADTIANEARKGYGMLLVGLDKVLTGGGAFKPEVEEIAKGFEGPLCLVVSGPKASSKMPVIESRAKILVPINGTEVSRRAADLALALARPYRARVKALYVSRGTKGGPRQTSMSHQREEAVLKDIVDLADRYGVPIETAMRTRGGPDGAILREAAKGVTMIVMGVTQRPGDQLFFGDTATAVLAKCAAPVVLVASDRGKAQ
jgi:nucleotide-binding universal stress UspA family protein